MRLHYKINFVYTFLATMPVYKVRRCSCNVNTGHIYEEKNIINTDTSVMHFLKTSIKWMCFEYRVLIKFQKH